MTCEKCGQPIPPTQAEVDAQARRSLTADEYATYCRMRDAMAAAMRELRATMAVAA